MPSSRFARVGAGEALPALSSSPLVPHMFGALLFEGLSALGHSGTQWQLLLPRLPHGTSVQPAGGSPGVLSAKGMKVPKHMKGHANRPALGAVTMSQRTSMSAKDAQDTVELVQNIGAGALARTIAQACIHPLDTIKTRMQVSSTITDLQAWQNAVAASCRRVRWGGLNLRVCNWVGPRGVPDLYIGLAAALAGTLPAACVFFATDEAMKRALKTHFNKDRRDMVAHVASSSAAAFTSALIRVPGDVLKHRVQAYVFADMWQAAQHVWRTQGVKGLYCGFGATLMRDVPEMALQFGLYEAVRKAVTGEGQEQGTQWAAPAWASHPMLLGGLAGATAATITTPLDVIKTQLQCQGIASATAAVQHVLRERGPAGLIAGMGPRVLQTTLLSATFFTLYEAFKRHLAASRAAGARLPSLGEGTVGHHHQLQMLHRQEAAAVASMTRVGWGQRRQAKQHLLVDLAQPLDV